MPYKPWALMLLLSGLGILVPVVAEVAVARTLTTAASVMIALAAALISGAGIMFYKPSDMVYPSAVRAGITALIVFLAFFAMEFSDRLVRQDGQIFYWNLFLHLPALLLFVGLVRARPWAWYLFRAVTLLGAVWFLAFVCLVPFADLQKDGVSAPALGRVYIAVVSLAFAAVLAVAFRALGQKESRAFYSR